MTAYEIVKAAYPGIPDAILNQYADVLPAESVYLNTELNNQYPAFSQTYANAIARRNQSAQFQYVVWWARQVNVIMSASIKMLNPQNELERVSYTESLPFTYSETVDRITTNPFFVDAGPHGTVYGQANIVYDRRLFNRPSVKQTLHRYVAAEPNRNPNAQAYGDFAARTIAAFQVLFEAMPYNGLQTIIAIYENGLAIENFNYEKAYEFLTYLNAYKKFSTQVDAEKALLEQQAKNNVDAYRQQLNDQAAREYSDLQSKKIQLLIAIDNEAKSAQRDYQNMLLTAQTLKQQIGGALGN